ncbi:MAG: hypothetical protein NUW01_09375 [Gemmatimonadaceae bacterium]|nr:hypothetical protein [Gemmatimonadaceae bacterium]
MALTALTYPCQLCGVLVYPSGGEWWNPDGSWHNVTCRGGSSSRVPPVRLQIVPSTLHPGLARAEKARDQEDSFEAGQGWR